jgi:putative protein-disulfide isomerase
MTLDLLYFVNPMCSWCWGFAPVVTGLMARHGEAVRVTLALGSLGRGCEPMRDSDRDYVRGHWQHVQAASGQPFDFAFFDRPDFVYDAEPASRAVAVARARDPALALPFLAAVQRAFYALNRDVTAEAELTAIAASLDLDPAAFAAALADPEIRRAVAQEFAQTAELGVTGYPTLLALRPGRPQVLTIGWRPLAEVDAALRPLLG